MISRRHAPGLSARMTVSLLGRVPTYAPSIFLALRTNTSRRAALGDHGQAPAEAAA